MENQHKKITGYRDLTQAEIDLMNVIKAKGEELRELIASIHAVVAPKLPEIVAGADTTSDGITGTINFDEWDPRKEADFPMYWLRQADCGFRTALMAATRAVAQPTSY